MPPEEIEAGEEDKDMGGSEYGTQLEGSFILIKGEQSQACLATGPVNSPLD